MKGALRPFLGREGAWGRPLPRPGRHPGARGTPLESWLLGPSRRPGPDDASGVSDRMHVPDHLPPAPSRAPRGLPGDRGFRSQPAVDNGRKRRTQAPGQASHWIPGRGWRQLCLSPRPPSLGWKGSPRTCCLRGWPWTAAHGAGLVEDSGGGSRWPLQPGPTPTQASGSYARLHPARTNPSSRPQWVHGAKRRGLWNAPRHSGMLPLMVYWV